MSAAWRLSLLAAWLGATTVAAQAEWQPIENVQTYAIAGQTGAALYRSIGERGPKVGICRAIAFTNFKLTWRRNYQPQGDSCVLVSAVPKLIITYTLPKPTERLPASTQRHWEVFIAGVRSHEHVHGEFIEDMVRQIEAFSVGLTVAGDPNCRKIREVLTKRLGELSLAQRQRSREFDALELGSGGNIHQLVLALVNGGKAF